MHADSRASDCKSGSTGEVARLINPPESAYDEQTLTSQVNHNTLLLRCSNGVT